MPTGFGFWVIEAVSTWWRNGYRSEASQANNSAVEFLVARYQFLTTWCIDAPTDAVFDVLHDPRVTRGGGRGSEASRSCGRGGETSVGELVRFGWRSVLPYSLAFELRATRVERPHLLEGRATGERAGVGM